MTTKNIKQVKILSVIKQLTLLPNTTVRTEQNGENITRIWIEHEQQYVPNFCLEWCPGKDHYRVYIHIASTTHNKKNAGYCICVIPTGLSAALFTSVYAFIHKHRSNNKTAAE